jgi:pimeloyl-ACP methyl ester carboxylesterase
MVRRFHLAGHDWGGSIAWALADRYPERLASLTVLSRPHPNAFNRALQMPDSDQAHRSRHHKAFLEPGAADLLLADDAKQLRERLAAAGVPAKAIAEHLLVLGNKAAMEAALTWYRARGAIRSPLGPIRVPTLYIWGDADDTVGRIAAEGTQDFVAAPYRFEVLGGISHFAADQAPDRVNELLLQHHYQENMRGTPPLRKCCPAANGARRHDQRKSQGSSRTRAGTNQGPALTRAACPAKRPTDSERRAGIAA